jgi:hypothetical protein
VAKRSSRGRCAGDSLVAEAVAYCVVRDDERDREKAYQPHRGDDMLRPCLRRKPPVRRPDHSRS